ncbi:MAG: phosphotransferase [Pirellulales bacterium]|nr:phosphotransferase [Pirellulales bacterium]
MFEVNRENAIEYLRGQGLVALDDSITVRRLTGGISNEVLLVERSGGAGGRDSRARSEGFGDFVLKQARPQLRTPQPWFSSVERNWREVAVQRRCATLAPDHVPGILFVDRDNYLYAMAAVPEGHRVWRDELLAGRIDPALGAQCGQLLAALHAGSWHDRDIAAELGDRQLFHELRVAPYYEAVARDVPEARDWMNDLIASLSAPPQALVHADFSPKNLLLFDGNLTLVDFETGHAGDPAFDLGFVLAHLVLKTFYHALRGEADASRRAEQMLALIQQFWDAYSPIVIERIGQHSTQQLTQRGLQHLAGCLWARLDGTSRIDYLPDPASRERVRQLCRAIFRRGPAQWDEVAKWIEAAALITRQADGRTLSSENSESEP